MFPFLPSGSGGRSGSISVSLPPLQARVEQNETSLLAPLWRQQPQRVGRRRMYGAIIFGPAIVQVPSPNRAGDLATSLAALSASLDGTVERLGDAAVTLPAVAAALDGSVPQPQGDAAVTLAALTASLSGEVGPVGDVAVTLGLLAGSLDGTFVPAPIAGDLAGTLGALTMAMADSAGGGARFFFVEC